jgi:RNA polymerase sigma factor (sigma-70 family)
MRSPGEVSEGPAEQAGDTYLVLAAQSNAAAFDRLYDRYETQVLNYCYYRLGTWPDAEDAAQQIFTNAFARLSHFEDRQSEHDGSFRSWLFTIAHHEIANRKRHHVRHPDAPLTAATEMSDPAPGPEDLAVSADDQRRALALLSKLTAEQRQVVELRMAGLTDAEIATLLDKSPGAVRATQFRAVSRLRELLGIHLPGKEGGDV